MRNLKLINSTCAADAGLCDARCIAVDYDTKVVYAATENELIAYDPNTQMIEHEVSLSEYTNCGGSVLGIEHLPDQMAVCVALTSGDLLLWTVSSGELNEMGTVDSGVSAMAWSPDHEIVIIVTGQGTFIIMTRDFDPISEVPIDSEQFGEAKFITVGWGKKETQFHGSEGKQAAAAKPKVVGSALPWDDKKPRISWRGDGQFFAISTISEATGARKVRVWSRDGVLHSTSEDEDGIEQALAWRPSGSLIASSQRRPNKHDIAFFEKNGLRHGEFTLPFGVKDVKVLELLWNTESTVLAVWLEQIPADVADDNFIPKSWVQLYTVGNYHWYLKQSLQFPATPDDRVSAVLWDPEHAYCLHIVCSSGKYLQYTWSWATDQSRVETGADDANVAVIDGSSVLMTPFSGMVVPPPMCAYSLQLPSPATQVAFSRHSTNILISMADGRFAIYGFSGEDDRKCVDNSVKTGACGGNGFSVKCRMPKLLAVCKLEQEEESMCYNPLMVYHVTWLNDSSVLMCSLNMMGSACKLLRADVLQDQSIIKCNWSEELEGKVVSMSGRGESVAIQLADGSVLRYCDGTVEPWRTSSGAELVLPQMCTQMAVTSIGGEEVVLGLTERFRFYVNDLEMASNCTSFAVHDDFLLLTTHSHTVRCISRNTKVAVLPTLSDGKAHPFDESVRRVERGSRIVTVVTSDTKLVLQMPRGNLEAIHPRALVLSTVRKHLDSLEFGLAFTVMRKHRINMNLLYDHSPQSFLTNTQRFVRQVAVPNNINLFLTDLIEEDVTATMYTAAYNRQAEQTSALADEKKTSKVDSVCDAVRIALEDIDQDKYLLSILTAYVRRSTPQLDTALLRIKAIKDSSTQGGTVAAEEALKYLLFLVDVNELYDVALGTYDFTLVLMVAEKSQKDPKEYIPFLNELRRLEDNYQKYTIDKHLKRYSKALTHIVKCGKEKFNQCTELVKEHKLFTEALALYSINSDEYKDLCVLYGEYLSSKGRHEEAAIMYQHSSSHLLALEEYQAASNWRMALCSAALAGYSQEKVSVLARSMAAKLKGERKNIEAACLLELYANDVEEAIVTLIDGGEWEESLRLMYKHGRVDFLETNLRPTLDEAHDHQTEFVSETHQKFERHLKRLRVVRQEKEKRRLEILEGGELARGDTDLFSDTSSATGESVVSGSRSGKFSIDSSRSTIYSKATGSSRKAKRKHEKKKWSLKEGSANEDIALIESLYNLIKQVDGSKGDIHKLLRCLVLHHYEKKASALQKSFERLLKIMEASLNEIWDPDQESSSPSSLPTFGPESTANTIALAMQQGRTPAEQPVCQESWLKVAPTLNKDTRWKLHITEPAADL